MQSAGTSRVHQRADRQQADRAGSGTGAVSRVTLPSHRLNSVGPATRPGNLGETSGFRAHGRHLRLGSLLRSEAGVGDTAQMRTCSGIRPLYNHRYRR